MKLPPKRAILHEVEAFFIQHYGDHVQHYGDHVIKMPGYELDSGLIAIMWPPV